MKFWTWTEIKARLDKELDLDDYDGLVDETELLSYTNDAIDDAEGHILTLHEDYFLTPADLTLVDTESEIAFPSDIYAGKIRAIIYKNGTDVYEVKRVKSWKRFLEYRLARTTTTNTEKYQYFLVNATAGAPKIVLTPAAYESGTLMEAWYIRNANRLTTGADKCDIPEFIQFILWHVKATVLGKDGHPMAARAMEQAAYFREHMISTLTNMTLDNDNEIEADLSHYSESV